MSEPRWLLYGAYGYTGELVAREALRCGLRPLLAGRDEAALADLAERLGLDDPTDRRAFPLTDPGSLRAALADVDAVLHCAGPFVDTSRPMVEACLDTGTHYLDITGEIAVFEAIHGRDGAARDRGVVLLPGVGFDVVPTDCLAARLAAALPEADDLELAFVSEDGGVSRGTAKTMVRNLPHAGAVRRDGRIVPVPAAWDSKKITLPLPEGGSVERFVMSIPWGDVSTAFHTTGIPNVRTYAGTPPKAIRRMRRLRPLLPVAGWKPVRRLLLAALDRRFAGEPGPDAETRTRARVLLHGVATAPDGRRATATLVTPEGYELTARTAVECVQRVLAGDAEPGARTPAGAFGPDLVSSVPGVHWGEVELEG